MSRVAIVGAGAWGCALAWQATRAGASVTLWAREPGRVRDPALTATSALPAGGHDAILLAVPVQHLRGLLKGFRPEGPVVMCSKGIEAGTGMLPLEIVEAVQPGIAGAVLTGPNFAGEIAAGLPAAAVVAAVDPALRATIIGALASGSFRLYGNDDPVGAQLGGAAKNVIAIAAGVVVSRGSSGKASFRVGSLRSSRETSSPSARAQRVTAGGPPKLARIRLAAVLSLRVRPASHRPAIVMPSAT